MSNQLEKERSPSRTTEALPAIPVIETGRDFPIATLMHFKARAHDLFDVATRRYPRRMLTMLDGVSRSWLVRNRNPHLNEIDEIAKVLGRPGTYFFSINYEWGCTCRVAADADTASARLMRVLDWMTPGLGRNIVCARVSGAYAGPFAVLTWPGYSGVLQVMAPGRFSAALNQAPMRNNSGLFYIDWASGRRRVWAMPHPTPAHLLRKVASGPRRSPKPRPCCAAAHRDTGYLLLGRPDGQANCRHRAHRTDFRLREGAKVAANHWEAEGWHGHPRGVDSHGRARMMIASARIRSRICLACRTHPER